MTGRHARPTFDVQADGTDPWPYIVTADGKPVAHVTDEDTATATVDLAAQIAREGFTPRDAVRRALQDHQDPAAEGSTEAPGWIDHLDYDQGV